MGGFTYPNRTRWEPACWCFAGDTSLNPWRSKFKLKRFNCKRTSTDRIRWRMRQYSTKAICHRVRAHGRPNNVTLSITFRVCVWLWYSGKRAHFHSAASRGSWLSSLCFCLLLHLMRRRWWPPMLSLHIVNYMRWRSLIINRKQTIIQRM